MPQLKRTTSRQTRTIPAGRSLNEESWSQQSFGVEPDDPALIHIGRALAHLQMKFGFDPADPEVRARAVAAGHRDYEASLRASEAWAATRPEPVHVVYYVRIGNLIKIGTTGQLAVRLKSFPPTTIVLATEPGTYELELQRHRQFRDTRVTTSGEYFYPSVALIEHINSLRETPLTAADLAA